MGYFYWVRSAWPEHGLKPIAGLAHVEGWKMLGNDASETLTFLEFGFLIIGYCIEQNIYYLINSNS